ncbi:MAG: DUF1559 domain-containing protein [Pirellulales bacterium]
MVELIIVVGLLTLLVALLLTGVQHAREAARRTQCQSNLRNIGVAIELFDQVHQQLPCATYGAPYNELGRTTGSALTKLLPHLEQQSLSSSYDWSVDWTAAVNQRAVNTQVSVFRCPSSAGDAIQQGLRTATGESLAERTAAVGDFTAVYSWGFPLAMPTEPVWRDIWGVGALSPLTEENAFAAPKRSRVRDGAANTLTFVERAASTDRWIGGELAETSPSTARDWAPWAGQGCVWLLSYVDGGRAWSPTGLGPCNVNCSNHQGVYAFHPGAANVLFLDGHVKALSASVEAETLFALVTRARGDRAVVP